jgi:SAM-dependent methyltransferase
VTSRVQRDFDRIALLPEDPWDHNRHYHALLLRELPDRCERALEIGCGTGGFSRLLAARCGSVLAIDLAPNMIRIARDRSRGVANLEFRVADAASWPLPPASFDCVASIATLHHLDAATTLARMRDALAPGGVLLVLDIFRAAAPGDFAASALAFPLNVLLRLAKTGRLRAHPDARRAWEEHGRHDRYPTVAEVRATCASLLPGARVRRHLFWRYSLVWREDSGAAGRDAANVSPGAIAAP